MENEPNQIIENTTLLTKKKRKTNSKEYNRQYYLANKQKTLERILTVIACPSCGGNITYQHLARHKKTKLCQKLTLQKNENKELMGLKEEV